MSSCLWQDHGLELCGGERRQSIMWTVGYRHLWIEIIFKHTYFAWLVAIIKLHFLLVWFDGQVYQCVQSLQRWRPHFLKHTPLSCIVGFLTIHSNHAVVVVVSGTQEGSGLGVRQDSSTGREPLQEKPNHTTSSPQLQVRRNPSG